MVSAYVGKFRCQDNRKNRWGLWFFLTLYWLVSGYGERYLKPLVLAVVLLGVCSGLYLWLGLCPKGESMRLEIGRAHV